ncbi:hypothetical protein MRX96_033682 [Rhipicephalus microplus]
MQAGSKWRKIDEYKRYHTSFVKDTCLPRCLFTGALRGFLINEVFRRSLTVDAGRRREQQRDEELQRRQQPGAAKSHILLAGGVGRPSLRRRHSSGTAGELLPGTEPAACRLSSGRRREEKSAPPPGDAACAAKYFRRRLVRGVRYAFSPFQSVHAHTTPHTRIFFLFPPYERKRAGSPDSCGAHNKAPVPAAAIPPPFLVVVYSGHFDWYQSIGRITELRGRREYGFPKEPLILRKDPNGRTNKAGERGGEKRSPRRMVQMVEAVVGVVRYPPRAVSASIDQDCDLDGIDRRRRGAGTPARGRRLLHTAGWGGGGGALTATAVHLEEVAAMAPLSRRHINITRFI